MGRMSFWTQYWTPATVDREKAGIEDGDYDDKFDHTAGNMFRKRGVAAGDVVYVVSLIKGTIHIIGRMVVNKIVDQAEAERERGPDLWEADDQILAKQPSSRLRFDVVVPAERLNELEFVNKKGTLPLAYNRHGGVDQQTLRGLRELTASTAGLFDSLLN
jgi:hypothetical protein